MLLLQKFQKLYSTPKLLKVKSFYFLVFFLYNCSSIPLFSDKCDFPNQALEPGGIINLIKNDINHNLLNIDYLECGIGNNTRIIAPIPYNSITNNKKTGKIIRNQNDVSPGDVITTKVSETLFDSKVIKS